jgi:predicted hotdog family 3-hydroxylacyl-ACP dehydratase
MMLGPDAMRDLVPHAGAMCLLDGVESWDAERIRCVTRQHRSASNPLAVDGKLSSIHGIEFAAQAMAAHGALIAAGQRATAGLLLSVRHCRLHQRRLDDIEGPLSVIANLVAGNDDMWMYDFLLQSAARTVVEGRASVLQRLDFA